LSAVDAAGPRSYDAPLVRSSGERLINAVLFVLICSSSFIVVEPAPYEAIFIVLCVAGVIGRMRVEPAVIPLMLLLLFWNLSGAVALVELIEDITLVKFIVISIYLSMTAVVFACLFAHDCVRRVELMRAGYIFAAVIVTIAGIIGYFKIGGEALAAKLTWAERATGTFKDPNLLGNWLVLPIVYLFQRMLVDGIKARTAVLTLFLLFGLLLSFSRAAWGVLVFASLATMAMMWLTAETTKFRMRIVTFTVIAAVVIAAAVAVMLSFEQIRDLMMTRLKVVQSYDAGPMGRFGRHIIGFLITFDHPIGLGAFEFARLYGEAAHNTFLKSFVTYGWLGGLSYLTMVVVTLWLAVRNMFAKTPWQQLFIPISITYVGLIGESFIIDIDHWRHFHLLTGLVWGLSIATARYKRHRAQAMSAAAAEGVLSVAHEGVGPYSPRPFGA
jgi:hypothetical protein